jgi:hypothetical protein
MDSVAGSLTGFSSKSQIAVVRFFENRKGRTSGAKALIRPACFGTAESRALRRETFSHRGGTAGLSTTLRSGRDDNLFGDRIARFQEGSAELKIPRLPPDFLSRVAASVNCMWFSLGRTT